MNADYGGLQAKDEKSANAYTATGIGDAVLANRVSHLFDLHGPSVTLNTACSSGMTTVHLGAKSILTGKNTVMYMSRYC